MKEKAKQGLIKVYALSKATVSCSTFCSWYVMLPQCLRFKPGAPTCNLQAHV